MGVLACTICTRLGAQDYRNQPRSLSHGSERRPVFLSHSRSGWIRACPTCDEVTPQRDSRGLTR
jgi:hypothetical protein